MINSFVNTILAITGMAVILSLGILNLVDTEPHGFGFGLLWLAVSLIMIAAAAVVFIVARTLGMKRIFA